MERERRTESLFDEIMAKTFPYQGENRYPVTRRPTHFNYKQKKSKLRYMKIKLSKVKGKERIMVNSKKKVTCHTKASCNNNRFLSRDVAGQK